MFVAGPRVSGGCHVDTFGSNFWMALFEGKKKWVRNTREPGIFSGGESEEGGGGNICVCILGCPFFTNFFLKKENKREIAVVVSRL